MAGPAASPHRETGVRATLPPPARWAAPRDGSDERFAFKVERWHRLACAFLFRPVNSLFFGKPKNRLSCGRVISEFPPELSGNPERVRLGLICSEKLRQRIRLFLRRDALARFESAQKCKV